MRKNVTSKAEIETTDRERAQDLNMYFHLHEFDPVDLMEDLDMEEKYKRKKEMEAVLEKFNKLPESEQMAKFMKYEKLNIKTKLYN